MRAILLLGMVLLLLAGLIALKLLDSGQEPVEALEHDTGEGQVILGVDPYQERVEDQVVPTQGGQVSQPISHPGQAPRTPDTGEQAAPSGEGPRVVYHNPEPETETRDRMIYTVRPGDNLYKIIERSYGRFSQKIQDAIVQTNGLEDPSKIRPGQKLTLPTVDGYPTPKPN